MLGVSRPIDSIFNHGVEGGAIAVGVPVRWHGWWRALEREDRADPRRSRRVTCKRGSWNCNRRNGSRVQGGVGSGRGRTNYDFFLLPENRCLQGTVRSTRLSHGLFGEIS